MIYKRIHAPLFLCILTLMLSCAAGPLKVGSADFFQKKIPLRCSEKGERTSYRSLSGEPFLLYIRSDWCTLCEGTDDFFRFPPIPVDETGDVSVLVISVSDGYVLTGERRIEGIKNLLEGEGKNTFLPYEGSWKRILTCEMDAEQFGDWIKEKRTPLVAGISAGGTVVGRIVGFHEEVWKSLRRLLHETKKKEEIRGGTVSSPDS